MWNIALAINTCAWSLLGVFLVYSAGTLILEGAWHQFVLAALLFTFANFSEVVIAILAS